MRLKIGSRRFCLGIAAVSMGPAASPVWCGTPATCTADPSPSWAATEERFVKWTGPHGAIIGPVLAPCGWDGIRYALQQASPTLLSQTRLLHDCV
jgi:hypothetical protein